MAATNHSARTQTIIAVAAALAILAFQAWFMADNARDLCDDALISARYARNWAQGDGLTYNRDGRQPVEGYSNFLWVAIEAAGFKLGLEPRTTTAWAGGACALAATLLVGVWVWRITRRRLAAVAAMAALGLSLPFDLWAVQGLETPLIALLFLAVAATIDDDRPRPWPWFFALLAAMTRPDGLLAAVMLVIVEARRPAAQYVARPSWPWQKITGRMLVPLLWFALPFLAYTLWRWHHFGALLPNTFGAKTGMGMAGIAIGFEYVISFIYDHPLLWLLWFAWFVGVIAQRKKSSALFAFGLILAYLLFVVGVGGDFMPDHRFMMHVFPLMVGLGLMIGPLRLGPVSTTKIQGIEKRLNYFYVIVITTAFVSLVVPLSKIWLHDFTSSDAFEFMGEPLPFNYRWHFRQAEWYGQTADWLRQQAKRTDLIAAGDIGYIGYVTEVDRILDFNGLVDRHLASLPGAAAFNTDPDYVFGQRPEWLVLMVHKFDDGRELGHSAFDRAAFADPRLQFDYSLQKELFGWVQAVPVGTGEPPTLPTDIIFRIYRRR